MFSFSLLPRPALRNLVYAATVSLFLTVIYYNVGDQRPSLISSVEFNDVPVDVWETRAKEVKDAFLHAYHGYEKYAAPSDELLPVSDSRVNQYGQSDSRSRSFSYKPIASMVGGSLPLTLWILCCSWALTMNTNAHWK